MTTNDLQKQFTATTPQQYIEALQAQLDKLRVSYEANTEQILGNKVRLDLMTDLQQYITQTKLLLNKGREVDNS